ncbi:DDHD domain-containing protein [Colletotrichum plurivorum]|uniref:DDHD domain-containing protein n=1 Tax=Colletotrichum plurivorum TaxID=2175906 RepID=A0A8H6N821_9PEZI|nr:DDHD domain-containing protein [Colletotrichum plurivorum]
MAPGGADRKAEKSYLSSAVDSINPWSGSRSSTPTPRDPPPQPIPVPTARPGDHSITHLYGQSTKSYPADCPPLNVLWYHATDVPKRKPQFLRDKPTTADDTKPPPQPKKFLPFSKGDSRAIEAAYQRLLEDSEKRRGGRTPHNASASSRRGRTNANDDTAHISIDSSPDGHQTPKTRVPVNEDYLFDVDIETRELAPVYWLGPVYEVRRGTWFYDEGSSLRPCEENLASQLEEGYLKVKPWLYPKPRVRSDSKNKDVTPKASAENLRAATSTAVVMEPNSKPQGLQSQHQPSSHRLFGTWMNSIATYQDSATAWLTSDSMLSWVTSTMYERFSGGGYMSGIKLVRGYSDIAKNKKEKQPATPSETSASSHQDEKQQKLLKRRSAPPTSRPSQSNDGMSGTEVDESREDILQRQISSLMEGAERNQEEQEEEIRKREEKEIENDYNGQFGETQGRDIEHLVLVTHGIGQLLGIRMESVNFVHDVNILRKTIKSVYSSSADLRALNSELEDWPRNCRVQVLPVCWRHLLDFPKKREKKNERDIGDGALDDDEYPSLEDITIEGVAFARSLISDLALDVLLYQSAYREQIAEIVLKESNRIFKLFLARNPNFKGKVHVIGHSLGSAIMFDILCRQKEKPKAPETPRNTLRFWPHQEKKSEATRDREANELKFEFDVEDFYCLGSPVGLFQMLKGRTISARHLPNSLPSESPLNPDVMDDPFLGTAPSSPSQRVSAITGLPYSVSSPKVSQLFNVFHPSDPISYRLEPLISPVMSTLKPQVLPYTKKGIFSNVAQQGLTGIGMKVGQSVSGLWSSLSAGIASNLLNRSLGLSNEDVAKMNSVSAQPNASGAGTNIAEGGVISDVSKLGEKTNERKKQLADSKSLMGRTSFSGNEMTLIDDELETLYSKFQEKRVDLAKANDDGGAADWIEAERKAQKLRREEMKVRALNRNGRVDYSIQESVLDFNPMNTIASHMGYWSDEDVSHFILSQLLSNRSRTSRR